MKIDDYAATVKINSTVIPDWSGFEVTNKIGQAETIFSVDLRRPITINENDTCTIMDGFEGSQTTLVNAKEIEAHKGSLYQRTFSGLGSKLSRKAPSRTVIFINQTWLNLVAPGYVYKNKILYKGDPGPTPYQINGVCPGRLMVPGLPGFDTKDHEFECILQIGLTYRDIALYIAGKCGLNLVCNTPNLSIQKTFAISSGETWWAAIPRLFAKFNPQIFIRGTYLHVLDCGGDNQAKPEAGTIYLLEDAFTLYQWEVQKDYDQLDHVVINGPSSTYTYVSKTRNFRRASYSSTSLPGEEITEQIEELYDYSQTSDLEYLELQTITNKRIGRRLTTLTKKLDTYNPENVAITEELVEEWDEENTKIHELKREHEYASFRRPTRTFETEYALVWVVAQDAGYKANEGVGQYDFQLEYIKMRESEILYGDYLDDAGEVETDEETYEQCVTYTFYKKIDGTMYPVHSSTRPIRDAMMREDNIYSKTSETGVGWSKKWMLTRTVSKRFSQCSGSMLRKTVVETKYVPTIVQRTYSEDIQVPPQRQGGVLEKRWEYFKVSGLPYLYTGGEPPAGDYHPKLEITDQDIVDDTTAYMVALRLMTKRRGMENYIATVELTLPIKGILIGGTVHLPECTKTYFNWSTNQWATITMPAKTYWIVEHTRAVKYLGEPQQAQRGIDVKDRMVLKEYF
jgi:hypothetical protein